MHPCSFANCKIRTDVLRCSPHLQSKTTTIPSLSIMTTPIQIDPTTARRLAVAAQRLEGPYPENTPDALLDVMRTIRCLQLDPIRAVERTQYLVLHSRLGYYEREHLHRLVYQDRHLMEYWAHAASIVLVEDYPLHEFMMRHYGKSGSRGSKRLAQWVRDNDEFRQYILAELETNGPLQTNAFEDRATVPWKSGGWTSGRSVGYMIDYLWSRGEIMVAQRDGLKRWWDLSHRVLPEDTPAGGWSAEAVTQDALQKSLKALGVGRANDIARHFIERRYPHLAAVLADLTAEGVVLPVEIDGWDGEWFIHRDLLPTLERLEAGEWQGRTVLLSPFDNLIRDRDRTELMWDFYYRIEIYVPKAKREYGYYVLPILHGDRLIGRMDSRMDRKKHTLTINAVYLEAQTKPLKKTGKAVWRAITQLGRFLHAKHIAVGEQIPENWKSIMQDQELAS